MITFMLVAQQDIPLTELRILRVVATNVDVGRVTWSQQFPPVSPSARCSNTNLMVFDSHLDKVVLFGGATDQFIIMNNTWEWDGTSKTWTQTFPTNSPSPANGTLACCYSADG